MTEGPLPSLLAAVVEDDPGLRAAMVRMLLAAGWQASGYDSAEALLSVVHGTPPQPHVQLPCLVLDLCLPGLSGFELLDRLRAAGLRPHVIAITAHDDPSVRQRAHDVGATYLTKPFTGEALLAAVQASMHAANQP